MDGHVRMTWIYGLEKIHHMDAQVLCATVA